MTKKTLLYDTNVVTRKINGQVAIVTGNSFKLYPVAHSCSELRSLPNGVEFDSSLYVLVSYPSSKQFPHGWTGVIQATESDRVTYLVNKYWREQQLNKILNQDLAL